jgi:hypothetical protein
MKYYSKLITVILLVLLSFFRSTEIHKEPTKFKHVVVNDTVAADDDFLHLSSGSASGSSLKIYNFIKKQVKLRGINTETSTLKTPFFTDYIRLRNVKKEALYNLKVISHQLRRHTHLHLYQLF